MFAVSSLSAATATIDGVTWTYYTVSGGVSISRASPASGSLTIPSGLGGYDVVGIATEAFRNCSGLTGVTIPDSVKSIGTSAFRSSGLRSVTIGNGVTTIGNSAFYGCKSLKDVALPDSVKTIDNFAFYDCDSLTSIVLPYSVTTIGPSAFADCAALASVTIGRGVTKIGSYAFRYCAQLASVRFEGNCPGTVGDSVFTGVASGCTAYVSSVSTGWGVAIPGIWESIDIVREQVVRDEYTVRFNANGGICSTDSIVVGRGQAIGDLPVPTRNTGESGTFLGWFTVSGVEMTESTVINDDMTVSAHWSHILRYRANGDGTAAFAGYSAFGGEFAIPSEIDGYQIVSIAANAFSGGSGLASVTIPDCVTNIDASALSGCIGIERFVVGEDNPAYCSVNGLLLTKDRTTLVGGVNGDVTIPDDVTRIADYAFYGRSGLTDVTMPESVAIIGAAAFSGCSGLTSVTIPDSVTSIGSSAFYGCRGLVRVCVNDIGNWCGILFADSTANPVYSARNICIDGVPQSSLVLPDGVTNINAYTFYSCTNLLNVTIPASVERINSNAFNGCSKITDVAFYGNAPSVGASAFGGCYSCTAHVRRASTGWGVTIPGRWNGIAIDYMLRTVTFDANGGTCETATLDVKDGSPVTTLPEPTWDDAIFLGWFTAPERGEKVDGSFAVTDSITLYAHWLTEVANPVIMSACGSVFRDESCEVSITCETEGAKIYYTDDGTTPKRKADYLYSGPVTITDTATFKAVAVLGGLKSGYTTVTITKQPLTLEEALDFGDGVTVETDASFPWEPVFHPAAKAGDASARSAAIGNSASTWMSATVSGSGKMLFWCKVSCEHDPDNAVTWDRLMVYTNDVEVVDWRMDGETDWTLREVSFEGGENTVKWVYYKDKSGVDGEDCAWVDGVTWTPSGAAAGVSVEVNGAAVEFETAADGKTRTAEVAEGTTAEDIKVFVGGVDVTAGFKVSVVGTTATMVLREPFERTDDAAVSSKQPYQENDDGTTVTLNVEVVPGLYYAADSAATIEALKRPGVAEPAKAGDAVVAPKQEGAQGFYKVWVSDSPMEAE